VRATGAELLDRREILPGQWLQSWHAPAIAGGARPGQFVHLRATEPGGLALRRPFPIVTADPAGGVVTLQVPGSVSGGAWLRHLRVGDTADVFGPLGRPFEVDPRSRHLLLLAEGPSIAAIRFLADQAVRDGRSVALLFGAASSADVYPSNLLPDEVEYVVATADGSLGRRGSVADLVLEFEAWADQSFASGSPALLARLATLAVGRRGRLGVATLGRKRGAGKPIAAGSPEARRRAFLQVVVEQTVGCAAGTCLGCVVQGASEPVRACREGPVFASDELAWPEETLAEETARSAVR
jgi:dihydroorotate dehydrogenase electron transfer subunit